MIYIDTHIAVWLYAGEVEKFSDHAKDLLNDNDILISPIVRLELQYLHEIKHSSARTLFATHFHELTELEKLLPRVKNYNIAVKEWNDEVIFLRKILEGGSDQSLGIQVARLAGLPQQIIERAREILTNLEANEFDINDQLAQAVRAEFYRRQDTYQEVKSA